MFTIEIIYAQLKNQELIRLELNDEVTIQKAIELSGVMNKYPEIDLTINKVGIFNQVKKLDTLVKDGDRVEIYRELIANPKDVRRKRAEKQKEQGIIK